MDFFFTERAGPVVSTSATYSGGQLVQRYCGFPQFIRADAGIVPQIGHDGFLSQYSQFFIHESTHHT
jgi:hypothetical protein